MTTSAILGLPYISNQQSQPDVTHNEAVSALQILLAGGALSVGLDTPPGSPAEGDTYILGSAPTGLWAGRPNSIAGFFLGQWIFVPGNDSSGTPIVMGPEQEGMSIWSKADDGLFVWTDLGASPGALVWRPAPSGITTLGLLDDTLITAPIDFDLLQFVDGLWRNRFSNTVFFSEESQLPAPSGGAITLLAGKIYQLTGSYSTSNRLIMSNGTRLTALNAGSGSLITYTGSGNMISGVDVGVSIEQIILNAPSGTVFDFEDTVGGVVNVNMDTVVILACAKIANFDDLRTLTILRSLVIAASVGMTFEGTSWVGVNTSLSAFRGDTATFIGMDLGIMETTGLRLDRTTFAAVAGSPSTAVGIKGLPSSGNIVTGSLATVSDCIFEDLTPFEGITTDDIRWNFDTNTPNVDDTMPDILLSLVDNATETVVSVSTPTLVTGTWNIERASHFTGSAAGRATYNGERNLVTPIDATFTVSPASGTNKLMRGYIAINGTEIGNSHKEINVNSGSPLQITLMWQEKLAQGDFVEIFVSNETDSTNIIVEDAVLRLR